MGSPSRTATAARRAGAARRAATAAGLAAIVALLLPALAVAGTHEFISSFGSFSSPESLAVDQARDLVYVLNRENGTVDRFDSEGQPASFGPTNSFHEGNRLTGLTFPFGTSEAEIAVAPPGSALGTGGDVFVTNAGGLEVKAYDPDGEVLNEASTDITGAFGPPHGYICGVAVDPSGAVYVADYGVNAVMRYVPTNTQPVEYRFDSQLTNVSSPCSISVGSSTLYVATWPSSPLTAYPLSLFPGNEEEFDVSSSGTVVEANGFPVAANASYVDPVTDELYVDEGEQVRVFDSTGQVVDEFGSAQGLFESHGVAVDSSLAAAFVADTFNGIVDVYAAPRIDAPSLSGLRAVNVTETEARLRGEVNPNSEPTHFHFEYVDDATFQATGFANASQVPVPDGQLGNGFKAVGVSRPVAGLTPGTTYHYRLVASNPLGTTTGEPRTFTTFAAESAASCPNAANRGGLSQPLPDCRAYEMVTPAVKDYGFGGLKGEVYAPTAVGSLDGDSVAFDVGGPLPGATSGPFLGWNQATRGATGWSSRTISAPQAPVAGTAGPTPGFWAFSTDLSKAVIETVNPPLTPEAPPDRVSLYLQDSTNMTWQLLTPNGAAQGGGVQASSYAGASDDYRYIYYWSTGKQTPDGPTETVSHSQVYGSVDGRTFVAGVLPNGTIPDDALSALSSGNNDKSLNVEDVVSADGTRVFFRLNPLSTGPSELYLRYNADQPQSGFDLQGACDEPAKACTVAVSGSQKTNGEGEGGRDPNPLGTILFWGATPDASRVIFTSPNELTDDANTGRNGSGESTDAGNDLYEYDLETGELNDLTADSNPTDEAAGANVLGVVGSSEDLTDVYFAATGNLAPGATSGAANLYLYREGTISFVATLDAAKDTENWGSRLGFKQHARFYSARVSPDGRFLAFTSVKPLTGFDNTDAESGEPDSEVFLFDRQAGTLACASCNPAGVNPVGASRIAGIEAFGNAFNLPRNLTPDGSRVFFNSADALVPRDTNGKQDVYEYENGRVSLLSGGIGGESLFADATPSGDDVFIGSFSHLVPQDQDVLRDLYDVRVGGGYPTEAAAAAQCADEGCRGPITGGGPPTAVPASSIFAGPGNPHRRKRGRHHKRRKHHRHHHKRKRHHARGGRRAHR
jgi:hypothetical protein